MPSLQRTIALADMHGIAVAVAEHLDFDVARLLEIFLQIHRIVAECRLGLFARRRQARSNFVVQAGDLHAASAAACRRLQQHG